MMSHRLIMTYRINDYIRYAVNIKVKQEIIEINLIPFKINKNIIYQNIGLI